MTRRAAVLALLLLLLAGPVSADAASRVPQGFAGVVLDGLMFPPAPGVDLGRELDTMVAGGVEIMGAGGGIAYGYTLPSGKDGPSIAVRIDTTHLPELHC